MLRNLTIAVTSGDAARVARSLEQLNADFGGHYNLNEGTGKLPLYAAIDQGSTDIVEMLLDAGADINGDSVRYNSTPLLAAVMDGHAEVVVKLLSRGVDVGRSRFQREKALELASARGHTRIVEILLEAGADVNYVDSASRTASTRSTLVLAAEHGHMETVEVLLRAGASVNITALASAAMKGHTAIARKLLDDGDHIDVLSVSRGSPLVMASLGGHVDIVDMLLSAGDIKQNLDVGGNALNVAAAGGHEAVVDSLVKAGVKPRSRHALLAAAKRGDESMVGKLLAAGLRPSLLKGKQSALYHASRLGRLYMVENLLAAGANGGDEATLVIAFRSGDVGIVEALIDAAEWREVFPSQIRFQAIHNAARWDNVELLEFLASQAVEISSALCGRFQSPLVTASRSGALSAVRFLLAHGCEIQDVNSAIRAAAETGQVEVVHELLIHGADLRHVLYEAAFTKRGKRVVQFLCSHPAVGVLDVDERTWSGRTPLGWTVRHRCRESMAALVMRRADVEVGRDSDWIRAMRSLDLPIEEPAMWSTVR